MSPKKIIGRKDTSNNLKKIQVLYKEDQFY